METPSSTPANETTASLASPLPRRVAYQPGVYEVKQFRREQARSAERKAIQHSFGEGVEQRNRCLASGLPLEHGQPIRVLLLARDERNHDADPRCYRPVQRWLPVGLPLRTRYRFGDDGFFPPAKDVAWRTLQEYFRTRYGVRLHHGDLPGQLVFNSQLVHPPAAFEAKQPLAVFDFAYVLEPSYRWLVAAVGELRNEHGESVRTSELDYVRRWVRRVKSERQPVYHPHRPFLESGDAGRELFVRCGLLPKSTADGWNEPADHYYPPCSNVWRNSFGGVGLGPVLHQILRGTGAATRALCEANLFVAGLALLPEPLRPTWHSGSYTHRFSLASAARPPGDAAWLQRRRAEWVRRQPVAKPFIGKVR